MAIPSGSGTEVLKRFYVNNLTNSDTKILDGVANHIYTVLSISFNERGGVTEYVSMQIFYDAGGTGISLLSNQTLLANETFVWNDKFVLTGTDELVVATSNEASVDCWISYIDQDFT